MSTPAILVREGKGWRQYLVVDDGRVAIVDMAPALWGGWNFRRVDVQGEADWPNMKRDAIVRWKMDNDDGRTRVAGAADLSPSDFRAKLLDRAYGGRPLAVAKKSPAELDREIDEFQRGVSERA